CCSQPSNSFDGSRTLPFLRLEATSSSWLLRIRTTARARFRFGLFAKERLRDLTQPHCKFIVTKSSQDRRSHPPKRLLTDRCTNCKNPRLDNRNQNHTQQETRGWTNDVVRPPYTQI